MTIKRGVVHRVTFQVTKMTKSVLWLKSFSESRPRQVSLDKVEPLAPHSPVHLVHPFAEEAAKALGLGHTGAVLNYHVINLI